ncbi:tRNA modification GTPase TrmE [Moraxella macacae 0408225]|uniref:tRNA modification GTPase MnmE n=1 Tax=Moraxella macacae 0408225 TaxID=1230338 RepID=L2F8L1_9GAMM|nr:tRNA uridine-5-carboxymethylaminomethyl(34) synthesis GTPase MnmE [Moraxella macacae]ELA09240.1 tRNA modification GTPase TrmE [Moraxella macacae 0408225]
MIDFHMQQPTICAIATPIGRGGVGVIRLSGKTACEIAKKLTKRTKDFTPRYAHFCRFYDDNGVILDEGLVLFFRAPHSFTGEDVVEIQGHGGMILQQQLLSRCYELGARQAHAGEFSMRAFENNKMDLVQAEAIADAIDATSVAAARGAMRSLTGEFSKKINELLNKLIHLRLHVEAAIDFPDEEDVDFLADATITKQLNALKTQVADVLFGAQQGQLLRDGVSVVIAGRPNAGKSSLLNRLAGTERAIVTDIAGTTRDILQETLVLKGLALNITDTAGLRNTEDVVEKAGIDRAKNAIATADLVLLVYDVTVDHDPVLLAKELFGASPNPKNMLLIGNKTDKLKHIDDLPTDIEGFGLAYVSCETQSGLPQLVDKICEKVGFHPPENTLIARTRHLDALKRVQVALNDAEQLHVYQAGELMAESLRLAQMNLSEITGEFSADDLLGKIFGSFCIGK